MRPVSLVDRMKSYEDRESRRTTLPQLPILVRLDGKNFSSYTKGLRRPFDQRLSDLMIETTRYLVEESNAVVGFTGSDEITLVLYTNNPETQIYFDGRIQKITSILAAKASVFFNSKVAQYLPEKASSKNLAVFDCRVWNVPSLEEAANAVLCRELDVNRNAISMAAQNLYSHKELQGKDSTKLIAMMAAKEVDFHHYPVCFKRGTYIRRVTTTAKFTPEEIDNLPPRHAARKNPDLVVERSIITALTLPTLREATNKVDVLFSGADPVYEIKRLPGQAKSLTIKISAHS